MPDLESNDKQATDKKITYQSDLGYPWEKSNEPKNYQPGNNLSLQKNEAMAFEHDLNWYLKIFGWPTLFLIILIIILEVSYQYYFPFWSEETISWIFSGVRWLIYMIIPLIVFFKFRTSLYQALICNLSSAISAGIIISVFQFIWYRQLWTIFNLIGLPLLMMLESLIFLLIIYGVFKIINK